MNQSVQERADSPEAVPRPRWRRWIFGRPLATQHHSHTLLPKFLALPVFASDAISWVAYATQEIVLSLGAVRLWVASQQAFLRQCRGAGGSTSCMTSQASC